MVYGLARIKLYNPISGNIIKDIEKENTFVANNIANYIKDMGTARNGYYPDWTKTVGGILCFRDEIQGTPQFMPNTNRMVANGSYGEVNTGTPVELGSYNENESIIGGDSITQVYDWNLSQGNGTISCISLTSQDGGYCGYGNLSGQRKADREFANNTKDSSYAFNHGFIYDNVLLRPSLSGTTLTIKRIPINVSKYNIFNNMELTDDVFDLTVVGTIDGFGLREPSTTNFYKNMFNVGGGKIAIVSSAYYNRVSSGGTVGYYEYDTVNHTLTKKTFTNSSENAINTSVYASDGMFITPDGYALCSRQQSSGTQYYDVFRISDSAYMGAIERTDSESSMISFGGITIPCVRTYHFGMNVLLDDKANPLPINAIGYSDYSVYENCADDSAFVYKNTNGGTAMGKLIKNPLYLATICNLDSPVTKTASMAMKIIYTLTEA